MGKDVVDRIQQFNQGRNPNLLSLKYRNMRQDIFAFLRGTCHLFYEDWPVDATLNAVPPVWVCGDLHLENFGSYKGDDRLVHFDINDFDEAALAPCTWDLARFLTSILAAAHTLQIDGNDAQALCQNFLAVYTTVLAKGQVGVVSPDSAKGLVRNLLDSLKNRSRKDFLNQRTEKIGKVRRLLINNGKLLPISPTQKRTISQAIETWAAQQKKPQFFRILDVAYRVAGTGSLGLERYALLIEGKGSPDNNYLLDLKVERPSSLQPYLPLPQPPWTSQANRVITIQKRLQWAPPALLSDIEVEGKTYVLRELQPIEDRINLSDWNGKLGRLRNVIETMASLTAWGQLLSSGRQGSAIADELIAFAHTPTWHSPLIDYAQTYAKQVQADYQEFCKANL